MTCHTHSQRAPLIDLRRWSSFFGRRPTPRRFDALAIVVTSDQPVRFECPADVNVVCLSGTAWITTEGDIRDVVLEAGQMHRACRGDRLFVNGLRICELRIE